MKFRLFFVLVVLFIINSCASTHVASYNYTQAQLKHEQIMFHDTLRIDEYINAFSQDWFIVGDNSEIVLRVDKLTPNLPKIGGHDLVQIAVKTRKASKRELANPVAISFVIDVSGSMGGEYISDTKIALVKAIQEMNKGDIASIVTFNNSSEVLASSVVINRSSRNELVEIVKKIESGGGTNIESGLVEGYREMAKFPKGITKRVLMLTDGQSTVNTKTPKQLASKARVEYMEGARISTIGLGIGVNQNLLRKIAKEGSGHYYFADTSKTLTKILREDLRSTIMPVARNITLNVNIGSGYEIVKLYGGNLEEKEFGSNFDLELGELNVDDWRIMIAELKRVSDQSNSIKVTGDYLSISKNTELSIVSSETESQGINQYVLRNSVIFGNASALVEASRLNAEKQYIEAINVLNLQINNNKVLASISDSEMLKNERVTLVKARNIIAKNNANKAVEGTPPILDDGGNSDSQENTRSLVLEGLKIVENVLPGLWSTIARVLIIAIE